MPRDPIQLDPAIPPEGASEVEKLLWRGQCPWCGARASFYPSEEFDGSLICSGCGLEFLGAEDDTLSKPPKRKVEKVFKTGSPGKRGGRPDDLPAVAQRPSRR